MKVCIAHGEGNYMADEHTIATLENDDRVAFRYCNADGSRTQGANPNGSINDIAGILSANRRVLGMMPHPENLIEDLWAAPTDVLCSTASPKQPDPSGECINFSL